MGHKEEEKRKYPRIDKHFVVSYRKSDQEKIIDISQTKNLSLGGLLLTTLEQFDAGAQLIVSLKVPSIADPIEINAKVVSCNKSGAGTIYETRLEFINVDEKHAEAIKQVVEQYRKKG